MLKYFKEAKWEFIVSNLLAIANVLCVSYYPSLLSYIIDNFSSIKSFNLISIFLSFVVSILLVLAISYSNKLIKAQYQKKSVILLDEMFLRVFP